MSDYTDLLSNVRDYTETTSDVLTDAIINQFIVSVEDKLRRTVDPFHSLTISLYGKAIPDRSDILLANLPDAYLAIMKFLVNKFWVLKIN